MYFSVLKSGKVKIEARADSVSAEELLTHR
jgi:hypothetical protein